MSITNLSIVAKDTEGKEIAFGFNPVHNKANRVTKFVAPLGLVKQDGSEGSGSAKDLRTLFKSQGVKGRELTDAVNKALRDGKTVRQARLQLFLSTAGENGFIPSHVEANAKGDQFTVKIVKAAERPDAKEKKVAKAQAERDAIAKENAELKERLAKLEEMMKTLAPAPAAETATA